MSYQKLEQHQQQLHRLSHLSAICGWDQAAMMPEGGNEARAEAMAELGVLIHGKRTAPELGDWIAKAESEPLDAIQRANLAEIKRHWQDASLLPSDLVEALSLAGSKCEHAWRRQRKENDWAGFAPNLEEVVRLSREVATLRAEALGVRPYDAMLALYEPGMTSARLDQIFGDLTGWLPGYLLLTGALFQITKKDVMESVGNDYATLGTLNTGENRVRGVEFSASGNITRNLSSQFGASFMESEVTAAYNPANVGKVLSNFADDSLFAQLRYQLTPALAVGTVVTYSSEMYAGQPDSAAAFNPDTGEYSFEVPSYTVVDLFASYTFTEQLDLLLNVGNVADEDYYVASYRSGAFTYIGDARNATLTLNYAF